MEFSSDAWSKGTGSHRGHVRQGKRAGALGGRGLQGIELWRPTDLS